MVISLLADGLSHIISNFALIFPVLDVSLEVVEHIDDL